MKKVLFPSLIVAQMCLNGLSFAGSIAREKGIDGLHRTQVEPILRSPCTTCISQNAYYHIDSFQGAAVQLDDGSVWTIAPGQEVIIATWSPEDDIFVKPYESCFTNYQYTLYNLQLHQCVKVNLLEPPLEGSTRTYTIVAFCSEKRLVMLSDNSIWYIDSDDDSYLEWELGNRLIVGVNTHMCGAKCPQILINADLAGIPYSLACFCAIKPST